MSGNEHGEIQNNVREFFSVVNKYDCDTCVVTYSGAEESIICELDDVSVSSKGIVLSNFREDDEYIICSFARYVALSLLNYNIPDWHHDDGGFGAVNINVNNQSMTAIIDHKISVFLPRCLFGQDWIEKWSCFLIDGDLSEHDDVMAHISTNQIHVSHGEIVYIINKYIRNED